MEHILVGGEKVVMDILVGIDFGDTEVATFGSEVLGGTFWRCQLFGGAKDGCSVLVSLIAE
jgi:hypothetical protein